MSEAGYRILSAAELPAYLAGIEGIAGLLGGPPGSWRVRDVADGNLNHVFLIDGPEGGVCVKQALPYVRVAGKGWPLPQDRAFFESRYMARMAPHVAGLAPRLHHYDPALFLLAMEKLEPHIILRRGLIEGRRYPNAARDVADYVAAAGFASSDLALRFEEKFDEAAVFAKNQALLRISVDLIFADPYRESGLNRWTRPYLADWAAAFREDAALKIAVARFRRIFLGNGEALIHGDLHSGSVMVTGKESRVIDGEFAFYGPIGFDLGAFAGNLILAYYAQPGHASPGDDRREYQNWLLDQIDLFWSRFRARFVAFWREDATGDAIAAGHFAGSEAALEAYRAEYLDRLFAEMLGFAAIKMTRRMLGYSQVADFLTIADPERRARLQAPVLSLARTILTRPEDFADTEQLRAAILAHAGASLDPADKIR